MRLFLLVGAIVTMAPIAFMLRSGGGNGVQARGLPGAAAVFEAGSEAPTQTPEPVAADPTATAQLVVTAAPPAIANAITTAPAPVAAPTAAVVPTAPVALTRPISTTTFDCPRTYEVVYGDYWVSIAKAHQVTLDEMLGQNNAVAEQPLYPGRILCLPASAMDPVATATHAASAAQQTSKSSTTATSTTEAPDEPATTKPPKQTTTTVAATTTTKPAPTTTKPAPTTTKPPPPEVHYGDGEIEAIIRDVWPDELEDKALVVANRESTMNPQVRNYCCFGLFQIYYETHKKWLTDLGVQSAEDLYDPRVNTYAAYVLYQRAGGWGPWGG